MDDLLIYNNTQYIFENNMLFEADSSVGSNVQKNTEKIKEYIKNIDTSTIIQDIINISGKNIKNKNQQKKNNSELDKIITQIVYALKKDEKCKNIIEEITNLANNAEVLLKKQILIANSVAASKTN